MLTELEVVDFLMAQGLVAAPTVVDGDLEVFDASRRNRNFRVVSRTGPSYLVKQGFGADGRMTVANEAAVYRALAAGGPRVARYLPAFHAYDEGTGVLVLELVEGARALSEHQSRGRFSVSLANHVGCALGALHHASSGAPEEVRGYTVSPFALSVHRPAVSWLRDISEANIELIKMLQNAPGVTEMLDELRAGWHAGCVVHNDYKADNCVVVRGRDGRGTGVRLVDWEGGGWGDPDWDAGSVLGDYLSIWLSSIPITGADPPERFSELAKFPLQRMRPALRSFWAGYVREARLAPAEADRRLVRAARYSAARLLQTAFEQTQASSRLTGTTMCLCQVAVNVLRRPHEAAVRLLGIPLRGVAAA
jgi:aminoglycoside phosphotransferase (APT) family kinase protein